MKRTTYYAVTAFNRNYCHKYNGKIWIPVDRVLNFFRRFSKLKNIMWQTPQLIYAVEKYTYDHNKNKWSETTLYYDKRYYKAHEVKNIYARRLSANVNTAFHCALELKDKLDNCSIKQLDK